MNKKDEQTIHEQFAAVDASFRLEGFKKTKYSQDIEDAIARGELTHEQAIAKIIADAKAQGGEGGN